MSYQTPINRTPKRRFVVGIDPDKNESGFAVYDRQEKKWQTYKALYFDALRTACLALPKEETEIYVEAGWENDGMNDYQPKSWPSDFNSWPLARKLAYVFQRGCDVGTNFGAGWAITHSLRAKGYLVHHYCPKTAKWDAHYLKLYTGITARTNKDVRDAIRAAYLNR